MSPSRRITVVTAVAAALVTASVAHGAGGLHGTYRTTLKNPAELKGTWALTLAKRGTYTVAVNGQPAARGTYRSTATTITFVRETGGPCKGSGTYAWTRSGKVLTFTRKREASSCLARAIVLGHTFRQVG